MAELPSSNPQNRLSVGVQNPVLNLAAYTPDPAAMDAALGSGFALGQGIGDSIILRPRQTAALQAQADLLKAQAESGTALVPAEEAGRRSTLNAQGAVNTNVQTGAEQSTKDLTDPGWRLRAAHAQVVALTDDAQNAAKDIISAHAEGDPKKIESAIKKKASIDKDLSTYTSRLNLLTANQTAAENAAKTTAAANVRAAGLAEGALPSVPQEVDTNNLLTAATNRRTEQAVGNQLETEGAANTAATLPVIQSAADAQVAAAAAGVNDPAVLAARQNAAVAGTVQNALISQAQLATTAAQISTGQFTGTVSPQLEESIRSEAAKLGVPSVVPGTLTKRPLGDVSRDYSKAVNIKEAEAPLAQITKEANTAASQLENYQRLQQLIGTKVPTGYLYGLAGKAGIDQIAAQFGSVNPKIREQIDSLQKSMIPDATRGLGRMTAPDIALFQGSLPGKSNTPQNNANLVAASVASNQRDLDKQKFYTGLVGPLKVNAVDQLWNQYIQSNPLFDHQTSSPTELQLNKNMLTPDQYMTFITASPQDANKSLAALAAKTDVSSLPAGNTAADIAAAPATVPFLAVSNARGRAIPQPNPKFWQPVLTAASAVRGNVTPAAPVSSVTPAQLLNNDPTSYLRPLGAVAPVAPISVDALTPR